MNYDEMDGEGNDEVFDRSGSHGIAYHHSNQTHNSNHPLNTNNHHHHHHSTGNPANEHTIIGAAGLGDTAHDLDQDDEHNNNRNSQTHTPSHQGSSAQPIKRARGKACSECRRLKVKCIGADDDSACERCRAAQRTCTFADPQRKRAKTEQAHFFFFAISC
jgi:Fungal Zn(2)-Cys(6) binuclear cluster domain